MINEVFYWIIRIFIGAIAGIFIVIFTNRILREESRGDK